MCGLSMTTPVCMRKKLTTSKLKKKLDTIFSRYVRLSYAKNGMVKCITCSNVRHYKEQMHAGHFIPRQYIATRFDERNVHPQCAKCNTFNNGEPGAYAIFIRNKYGDETIKELEAKKQVITKDFPYEAKIQYYTDKVSILERENG